jgi:hypothetical protein
MEDEMSDENNLGIMKKLDASDAASKGKRQRSSIAFPYMDLSEAVNLAIAIHNNVGTNPCGIEQLAAWVKQSPTSSAFRNRLSAARLFSVVDSERSDAIRLTEIGRLIVDPKREREGRAKAFLSVPLFSAVYSRFKGGTVPPTAALDKELVAIGVADTLKETARRVLERSADQAGFYESGRDRLVMPGFMSPPAGAPVFESPPLGGGGGGGGGVDLDLDPLLVELLKKIPTTAEGWAPDKRIRWFRTFAMNVSQIYDDDDAPVELKISLTKEATGEAQ